MLYVKFQPNDSGDFARDVKKRVNAYFAENNLSEKANGAMVFKTVGVLSLLWLPYFLILSNLFSPLAMLGLAIVMGIGMPGCGFCIGHDAIHGAYSSRQWVNAILGKTFDLMGGSSYMWRITHNVIHHTYTNIQGIDEDLEVSPLLRLSPTSTYYWFHRFQPYYALIAYSFTTLFWVFSKDYGQLMRKDLGPYRNIKHPRGEVAKLFAGKIFCYLYTIVVPLMVLDIPLWQFAIGYFAMHVTAGLILSLVFQLAHVCEGPDHLPVPDTGIVDDAWLIHQMKTTANFGKQNKLLCWYVGGLNFQVEHHLFPKVCSIHYPAISSIVERVARDHGVPYHAHETFMDAIKSHLKMLKYLGDPFGVVA